MIHNFKVPSLHTTFEHFPESYQTLDIESLYKETLERLSSLKYSPQEDIEKSVQRIVQNKINNFFRARTVYQIKYNLNKDYNLQFDFSTNPFDYLSTHVDTYFYDESEFPLVLVGYFIPPNEISQHHLTDLSFTANYSDLVPSIYGWQGSGLICSQHAFVGYKAPLSDKFLRLYLDLNNKYYDSCLEVTSYPNDRVNFLSFETIQEYNNLISPYGLTSSYKYFHLGESAYPFDLTYSNFFSLIDLDPSVSSLFQSEKTFFSDFLFYFFGLNDPNDSFSEDPKKDFLNNFSKYRNYLSFYKKMVLLIVGPNSD